jgi:adenylate cyclase
MTAATYLLIPGADGGTKIPLDQGHAWKIGRNDDNDVVISDDLVSRYHALLQHTEAGEYYLMDMGSRNGSFVNGARVSFPVSLKDGDKISLGDYQITFHWPGAAEQAAAPKAPVSGSATVALFTTRKTSVLVVDVRDFTKLTQRIDQSLLCNLIGTWFREGGQLMQEQGSWAQKYIGDALMSVWVHRKREQEAQEIWGILKACVDLVQVTATLQSRFELDFPIRIGMGINTGEATLGNTGSGRLNDYTALGDTVNAAFRFESATKDIGMDVIIGQDTFQCLSQCSDPQRYFVERTVNLKGYDRPAAVWATTFADLKTFVQIPPRA